MGKAGAAAAVLFFAAMVTIIVLSVGRRRDQERSRTEEDRMTVIWPRTEEDLVTEVKTMTEMRPITEEDSMTEVKTMTEMRPITEEDSMTEVKTITEMRPITEEDPLPEAQLWQNYRLPASLSPLYYNVTLWPQLMPISSDIYIFYGHSGVAFTCVNETDVILIHSYQLLHTQTPAGHHAKLTGLNGARAPAIKKTWFQVEAQYLVVQLREKLQVGKTYWLDTEFRGLLADNFLGFYKSEYFENGVKKVVASTQMQPTFARKVFPCFDEPAMKAVFHITLIHPLGTVALANSMKTGTETLFVNTRWFLRTRFAPTVKMSTYLLTFVVGDFISIKSPADAEVLIRIWAQRQAIKAGLGDYALNITGHMIAFFQKYYNSKFPLPKLDQIALPTVSVGALENSFMERSLLFDPSVSSNKDNEWALMANSHELAHKWFGNLVTMKWWNDLWLNEGIASYVSYFVAHDVQPTWNMKDLMVLNEVHKAFAVDAQASSHPLSYLEEEINTPAQIITTFDTITYSKGAAVLRMLSEFLSEPVFASGLSAYLKQFAYGNTVYTDLWGKLQEVVDSDPDVNLPASVTEIMNRWILQMGFPVVTIDTQTGNLSQKHFLLDSESVPDRPSVYGYEWFVPIRWMKNGTVMGRYWLLEKTAAHEPMRTDTEWVLANLDVSGFYRVNYDSLNWQRLLSQLTSDHSVIPVINRAQLVDDAFNLARAKIINTTLALSTTRYLSEEREYMPWQAAVNNLDYFFLMFGGTFDCEALQTYLRGKVQPLFEYFQNITADWTEIPSSHTDQYNQVIAISLGCRTGVEGCAELTTMWFRQWMENPDNNPIHPNLKSTVYCSAIAAGGVEEWEFGWRMYENRGSADEADKLLYGLSCTKRSSLLIRLLKYTLYPTMLQKKDAATAILHVANNVHGHNLAWSFIRNNWEHIISDFGFLSFSRIIFGVSKRFSTAFDLIELRIFQREVLKSDFAYAAWVVHHAMGTTTDNMKWMSENRWEVMRWLKEESA